MTGDVLFSGRHINICSYGVTVFLVWHAATYFSMKHTNTMFAHGVRIMMHDKYMHESFLQLSVNCSLLRADGFMFFLFFIVFTYLLFYLCIHQQTC